MPESRQLRLKNEKTADRILEKTSSKTKIKLHIEEEPET
jgi:hypothetical protein